MVLDPLVLERVILQHLQEVFNNFRLENTMISYSFIQEATELFGSKTMPDFDKVAKLSKSDNKKPNYTLSQKINDNGWEIDFSKINHVKDYDSDPDVTKLCDISDKVDDFTRATDIDLPITK